MSRFIINSESRLSSAGKRGALAFVACPIGALICSVIASTLTPGLLTDPRPIFWALAGAFTIGSLVGLVFVISGRSFTHEVQVLPDQSKPTT